MIIVKRRPLVHLVACAFVFLSLRFVWLLCTRTGGNTIWSYEDVGRTEADRQSEGPTNEELELRKYFHEPGNTDLLHHYDSRFFQAIVTDEERADTLHHMIRAYLITFKEKGLETWIAHGSLLGWFWNGNILPWDWDLDVQVSGDTLAYLGAHFNRTMHRYVSPSDRTIRRDYLLDVNYMAWERVRGDGMNVIDARWIDTRNGLFIDITGLSETEPEARPGVWSCKNNHRYHTSELYPLRDSTFEGVEARIPFAYGRILEEEYRGDALFLQEFYGYQWEPYEKVWVKLPEKNATASADGAQPTG